jgi:tetratricopeptide (TPR) repeat protein
VQRAANRVRVSAQLIDTRTDAHLWAERYDRDLADVFAIQSEIASAIAGQLQAKLSPIEKNAIAQRPTADLIAFDQYSRAKTLLLSTDFVVSELKNFSLAIELLNNAVARDPSFHAAFCQLVYAHGQIYGTIGDRTPARLAAAEAALQSASQLQPDSPETHLARGWHLYYTRRDYKGALAELEIARRGLANDPRIVELTGYILRRQGKHEEGLRSLEQAIALDPRNFFTMIQLAISYQFLRRYAQEAGVLDRALEVAPDDVAVAALRGVTDLYWRANPERLDHFIERLRRERPASLGTAADAWFQLALAKRDWLAAEQALNALPAGIAWSDGIVLLNRNAGAGLVARARGNEAGARQAFNAARQEQERAVQQQKDHGPALCALAWIDAALGNKEQALQEGRRAMELMPVEKDTINGQRMIAYFALIAAWAGEKDLALEQLKAAIPLPGASTITSYGVLKLLPFWDPLRGDPRFDQIVASLAPKESVSTK